MRSRLGMTYVAAACLGAVGSSAAAQVLEIGWYSVDGGGGVCLGGGVELRGVIGQSDARSPADPLRGGDFTLIGGLLTVTAEPCAADFNGDATVDTRDVVAFLNAWNAGDPRADVNQDGSVDTRDVIAFLNEWTAGCP